MEWTTATSRGALADTHRSRGTVLAVYPGSVYVAVSSPAPDLLVVHDQRHGHTPTSVLVDRSSLAVVAPGDPAAARAGSLRIGNLTIDVRHAAVWMPPAPSATRSAAVVEPARRVVRERMPTTAPDVQQRMNAVLTALGEPHEDLLRAALSGLVGYGVGLTPSGDDAVVGMLGVLHRVAAPGTAAPLLGRLRRAVPAVLERTTPISAHYLRLALRGAFSERLTALLDVIAGSSAPGAWRESRLAVAVDAVAAIGATSGADALAGVALTLDLLAVPARFDVVKDIA